MTGFKRFLAKLMCVKVEGMDEQECSEVPSDEYGEEGTAVLDSSYDENWWGKGFLEKQPYPTDGVTPLVHGYNPPMVVDTAYDRFTQWQFYAHWFEDEDLDEVLEDKFFSDDWLRRADCLDVDNIISSLLLLRKRT